MAIKNNKVSAIIEEQIPDFIREEHDNFVQFLKSYYEFLESESPPTRLPLIVANPFPEIYNLITNPYGGQFQIGETIQQKANSLFPDEVTASAKVFAWSADETTSTAIITSFGGTSKTFVQDFEIVGMKSGTKFFPIENTESLTPGASRASLDLLDTKDIDNTLEDYVQYIKNEFAVNLPLTLHKDTDTRKTLKNIREFYKARGTENSFKFLFRLLYGEDISIYLPETDMLRASDANWKNITIIRVEAPSFDLRTMLPVTTADLAGRKIKGDLSLATAIVEKATEIVYGGSRFAELELSNKLGTFIADEFIKTDNVGDGTSIKTKVLGLMNNVNITDPGSNYAVGDRVVVNSDAGTGAVAEVATINETSGAITSMKIVDPGYNYNSAPTLDMTTPHNADAGAARFEAGPLETVYYNDFSQYTDANSFFAESDNRGPSSNVGPSTNSPYDNLAYTSNRAVINPAHVTSNSIGNFVTVPGVDEGLKGYWKMNSYHPKDVRINSADGTANVGNDPKANNLFKGPRVGDITFVPNPNYTELSDVQLNYINHTYTNAMAVPDRTGANTYLSTGWTGFQPIVHDDSGQGHHARVAAWYGGTGFEPVHNLDFQDSLTPAGGTQAWGATPPGGGTFTAGTTSATFDEGVGSLAGAGWDPQLWSSTGEFSFKGSDYPRVTIRMRLLAASTHTVAHTWQGQMYYHADGHDNFGAHSGAVIPEPDWGTPGPNAEWKLVSWDFNSPIQVPPAAGGVTWMNSTTIDRLRWDFYNGGSGDATNGNIFEIDWIQIDNGTSLLVTDGAYIRKPSINLFSESAFANAGVFGAGGGNSLGTLGEGGLVLMPHDDISSANTQTWSFWYNPSEKPTGTMTDQLGSGSEMIVSRDTTSHWSWSMNAYSSSSAAAFEHLDTLFSFPNAKFDNGNSVGYYQKLANSAGYYPGHPSTHDGLYDGGGNVRAKTWNMFTLTIDYDKSVANVYIFNTTDGLLLANGFTLDSRFGPDTISSPNIVPMALTGQPPSSAYTHGIISGGNAPRLTTHAMHVQTYAQAGDPLWWAGASVADINNELHSATAGAANTARAEVIRDTPGANSYVTGNAFRTYNSNVATTATAPDGKMPHYIWTYLTGGSTTSAQNNKLREIDDPLGSPYDGVSPYLMEIPKGKRWIFSYYVKSSVVKGTSIGPVSASTGKLPSSDYDSGTLNLYKRFNDDGTANNWTCQIWKSNAWYASDFGLGYNTMPQYNTGGNAPTSAFPPHIGDNTGLEQMSHAGGAAANVAVAGTWFRKHQFFDLRHANTYYGYGHWGATTSALRVIDDYWDNAALTNRSNWDPIGSNMTTTYEAVTEDGPVLHTIIGAGGEADPRHQKLEANFNLQGEGVGAPIPAGNNPFNGRKINDFKLRWRANTTFTADPSAPLAASKLVRTETLVCWNMGRTNGLGAGIPTIPQLVSNGDSGALLRWTTTENGTMGGTDGDQTARAWYRGGVGSDGEWAVEYWRMYKIPTWRERTITGIEFQIFRDLVEDDAFDIQYVAVGQTPEPPGNEIDALAFQFLVGSDSQDLYLDGIMLEEAAEGQFEPSPYAFPNQGTETGALFLGTGIPAQGRAVKLGEKSESANGDSFQTESDQAAHGQYDEARYYDKALSWQQVESLFYNPGGRFDKTLSGDWKALNVGAPFSNQYPPNITFPDKADGFGIKYLRVGDASTGGDGLVMHTNKNIPFDPTVRYKMSANAKDESSSSGSNTTIGIVGISNTGIDIIGAAGQHPLHASYPIVMSRGGDRAIGASSPGTLDTDWATYTAVYGGNTTHLGTDPSPSSTDGGFYGHGGNTQQDGFGTYDNKRHITWANPARLFGDTSAPIQQGTGNTTFIRPSLRLNSWNQSDSTAIDFIKIEQQKDATLTAEIGAEFKQAGEYLDDSGKIGTSPRSAWRQKYIQDDRFYQIYSYVIKSGLSIGTYNEVVKKLVHPAGLAMFGQVDIETLASVAMQAFNRDDFFLADVVDLLRIYYMGAESSLLSDYADVSLGGHGVGYKAVFGLDNAGRNSFDLDAAHGENPHGAGRHSTGSPGWIAWDQSPPISSYANSHYYVSDDVQDVLKTQGQTAVTPIATGPRTYSLTNQVFMTHWVVISMADTDKFPPGTRISIELNAPPADSNHPEAGLSVITRTVESHTSTGFGAAHRVLVLSDADDYGDPPISIPYTFLETSDISISAGATITALTSGMWPYIGHSIGGEAFPTSNAYTTVTDNSLIWHIKGFRTILGTAYQNANVGALFAHSQAFGYDNSARDGEVGSYNKGWALATGNWDASSATGDDVLKLKGDVIGTNDWYHKGFGITSPLDIDGNAHKYVRMKVRRIGPGGYGADSWLGACQPETKPAGRASLFGPTMGLTPTEWNDEGTDLANDSYVVADRSKFYGSANTSQPSTLIIPSDALPNAKSPWHILEWDMSVLGTMEVTDVDSIVGMGTYPSFGATAMWSEARGSTGISSQDGGTGRRIGHIGFHLCYEPDNADEKFEIAWIQVDDGTGWPRGSYALPAGYVVNTHSTVDSSGAGTGGIPSRIRTSESSDFSNQTIGDFSVTVVPAATSPSEISTGAPVLYVHSDKSIFAHTPTGLNANDAVFDANGAIFRVSANTANNLDWVVTEIIDSEKLLRTVNTISGTVVPPDEHAHYIGGGTPTGNGQFSGPVILDTDAYDNLYVGYLYEDPDGGYPGFDSRGESKPLMLFRLTPTDNVQSDLALPADPHNLRSSGSDVGSFHGARGRSNTYSAEQILWGNTGGTDGVGVMVGGYPLYSLGSEQWGDSETGGASGSFVDFSTDDLGSLYIVGSGSQNIIKILPGANTSYANGFVRFVNDLGQAPGRVVIELANTTTLDANNNVLGNWRPTNTIPGPKDSLFVACDTGYDPDNRGANSVYCYHVVTEQNLATGEFYTKNVYPVFANTQSRNSSGSISHANENLAGLRQSCAGLVLDHEDPPNLYYMSANNMYRIKPKGYSYQIGDTEIEQVFPEDYFHNTLKMPVTANQCLGFSRHSDGSSFGGPQGLNYVEGDSIGYLQYQNNYQKLQVDSRNRIYFGGMANLFCYSRGSNTSGPNNDGIPLYNQSNTEFSTLQVVVNTAMYTSNVNFNYGIDNDYGEAKASIDSFVLGAKTSNSAFTGGDPGNPSAGANNFSEGVYITMHNGERVVGSGPALDVYSNINGRRLIAIYPNANGSFVTDEGGQLAMTIMDEDPAANTKFAVNGTGGLNKFRGIGPGKVVLRPEKV